MPDVGAKMILSELERPYPDYRTECGRGQEFEQTFDQRAKNRRLLTGSRRLEKLAPDALRGELRSYVLAVKGRGGFPVP